MTHSLEHVYDLRYDSDYVAAVRDATANTSDFGLVPEHGLLGSTDWWRAVDARTIPLHEIRGRISRVYASGHDDYPEFEIDDGTGKTAWPRLTSTTDDDALTRSEKASLYKIGAPVQVTYVLQKPKRIIPGLGATHEVVIGIWIGPPS